MHLHEHVIIMEAGNEMHEAASRQSEPQCFAGKALRLTLSAHLTPFQYAAMKPGKHGTS